MQQDNGSTLFHTQDPRNRAIGIIEVTSNDNRQSILTAILTQEKLGREQIAIVIKDQRNAFQRAADFEILRQTLDKLQTQVAFVAPQKSAAAKFAQQQHYVLFSSLEEYKQYLQALLPQEAPLPPAPPPPAKSEDERTAPLSGVTQTRKQDVPMLPPAAPQKAEPQHAPALPSSGTQKTEQLQTNNRLKEQVKPSPIPILLGNIPDEPPATPPATRPADLSPATPPVRPIQRAAGGRRIWLILIPILLILLLLGAAVLSIFMGIGPLTHFFPGDTANITITPRSTVLTHTYAITAQTNTADSTRNQVAARFISTTLPPRSATVKTSGHGITPATQARGILTFYNPLTRTQTIPAGTVFTDTKGIQVVNDDDVVLSAAQTISSQSPQETPVDAAAHAVEAGTNGEIAAFDFNTTVTLCCNLNVYVQNNTGFTGGQDQQPYFYVQQSDIDNAANSLKTTLSSAGEQHLKAQVGLGEQLVDPPVCKATITSNHTAGEMSDQVTATESLICLGEVYDQQSALTLAASLLRKDAANNPGPAYATSGQINTQVIGTKVNNASISLQIQATGAWTYQFPANWQTTWGKLIVDKNMQEATILLLQQPGVKEANITVTGWAQHTLPASTQHINFVERNPLS